MTSREPQSSEQRYRQTSGTSELAAPARPVVMRIRVEHPKPAAQPPTPAAQRALDKWTTTTEQLSAEERRIIQGYRLSIGGRAAAQERGQIEREIRRQR